MIYLLALSSAVTTPSDEQNRRDRTAKASMDAMMILRIGGWEIREIMRWKLFLENGELTMAAALTIHWPNG